MALFRRSRDESPRHPVSDFWTWWSAHDRAIDELQSAPVIDELTRMVAAIHPDLAWHFGPGSSAEHRLTVSSGGVAEVRPAAERWLRAAPQPDDTWEFASSQEADPTGLTGRLEIADHTLDLALVRFRIETDVESRRVHVTATHPDFTHLDPDAALHVTYLCLDWLLGEDDVERWIGAVSASAPTPDESTPDELRQAVTTLADHRLTDPWAIAQFEDRRGRGLAVFRQDVRWIDLPMFDLHHRVTTTYDAQENGWPTGAALDSLRQLEDDLEAAVGSRGILVAHESSAGARTFHVYTDGEDQNAGDLVRAFANRTTRVESTPDPSWRQVRRFTG